MGTPNLRGSSWSCHSLNLFAQLHFSCGFLESPLRLPGTVHRGATVASLSISLSDPLNPGLHGRGSPKPRPWHRALSRLPAAWSSIPSVPCVALLTCCPEGGSPLPCVPSSGRRTWARACPAQLGNSNPAPRPREARPARARTSVSPARLGRPRSAPFLPLVNIIKRGVYIFIF